MPRAIQESTPDAVGVSTHVERQPDIPESSEPPSAAGPSDLGSPPQDTQLLPPPTVGLNLSEAPSKVVGHIKLSKPGGPRTKRVVSYVDADVLEAETVAKEEQLQIAPTGMLAFPDTGLWPTPCLQAS